MSYSQFTLKKAVIELNLTLVEGVEFLNRDRQESFPPYLAEYLQKNLTLAIALNTEKARSELLICPLLLAAKEIANSPCSLFSGEEFEVEPDAGLTGVCDFLLSRSTEQLYITAPVVSIVEAKKEDLKGGLGQCIATMVAAWRFNQQNQNSIATVYGAVTTDTLWRFLKLEHQTVTIDLNEYSLPPFESILGKLVQLIDSPA
ncbi:hypothetical protein [Phormidium sp. CCY1219]|uniref:hypothetical protein n=1 Tax=Phormidium sp. CCY1219 TaxID=2886104 RepID=UPI002D1F4195|nr:hypothetical protein [Phormidium sp. CCY1219]MEB3831724.1 hypothetical protein [Phormidium sp. CCY1219]